MNIDILRKHKFQFIKLCHVYYPERGDTGNVQLNNDSHIVHICKGQVTFNMEDHSFTAKAGDVVAVPSFTPFTLERTGDFEMMNIHYKIWLDDGTLLEDIKRLPRLFTPSYFKWCQKKLLELKEIILQKNAVKLPDALAHEVVLRHFTENPLTDLDNSVSDPRMLKIQKILEDPATIKYDSSELASICGLSKSQMNRNFKNTLGISPQKYWEEQRMKNICIILKKSPVTIHELSERWGFKNSGYFCRWFKKMTGYTPTKYRTSSP